jgi:alkaline phosphatase D
MVVPIADRMSFDPQRRHLLNLALGAGVAPALVGCVNLGSREPCFGLGVASGCPRPDRLVIWTRLDPDIRLDPVVPVKWEMATDEAFRQVVQTGTTTAEADWGHSVHVLVAGLEPARWYWYRFTAMGHVSRTGRTRTAPAAGSLDAVSFAIASCQRWDHGHYAAWRHLADESPDVVLFLGDYIYEYAPVPGGVRMHQGLTDTRTLAQYRARYAQYKRDPDLQRAHASAPWIITWDDHEVQNDYGGAQSQFMSPAFLARRARAYQVWWENMPVPPATRPHGSGLQVFDRFDWGALARFHLLDDRQYRDPAACPPPGRAGGNTVDVDRCPELADPARTLLGAGQERWLTEGLSAGGVRWNFIAQQTLMAPFTWRQGSERVWTDGWSGYPGARARVLDTLAEHRVANPVVLGGDTHTNWVADLKRRSDAPPIATEFCGTSISSHGRPQAVLDAALPWNPHVHYGRRDERGYMAFRLAPGRLDARLRVVSDAADPAATIKTAAAFHVEAGRAGALQG